MLPEPLPESSQPDLFDHGQHARETRAIAAASALEKGPSRRDQIEAYLRERGELGATRHEIASAMGWPVQSVTSPVLAMLRSGRLIENGRKRQTEYGSLAAVIVINPSRGES